MKQSRKTHIILQTPRGKRGAFTLVEVLVALAVMMLMMTIILVPINMGMSVFHIGKARSEVQQANQLVINQLTTELKQAVHVFPNEEMPGITTKAPYNGAPYYETVTSGRVSNISRLDLLLPQIGNNGSILTPLTANNYIVTYYARRLDANQPYDVFSNPVVLWRAQYPYRAKNPYALPPDTLDYAANLGDSRYSNWSNDSNKWLIQDKGEPDLDKELQPTSKPGRTYTNQSINNSTDLASHTQITPRDMVLVSPPSVAYPEITRAMLTVTNPTHPEATLQPDSSFICHDADSDGKIDRVTISLLLGKYDSVGAAGDKRQQIRAMQTVSLPNIN